MSDGLLFTLVFAGLFILRGIAATIFFYFIIPEGDRCPNCDAITLRVQSRGWNLIVPRMRTSWCYECNWHGLLRPGPLTPQDAPKTSKTPSLRRGDGSHQHG
jgi:hypothetical protein